ncbi:non-specific lipid transfer protein GPI-anchored 1 [Carex littledalei]|uniref:Non-specific lipid transfer protein GPI-anchored 1 n=1 Tax=Carex littledalei TaxID=544730 RepID=A0A833QR13_9POAL|nr:non-specific lipid transfer protein GPI-anchored 1 [Carex littledalei]
MLTLKKQFFILLSIASLVSCDDSSLQTQCSPQISKLMPCLDYSTGKANTPSSECCSSATDIRKSNAACLCYVIQQTHAGNENSLGLRFDRLLSLPADCKLANTNVSNCPKLLNLSPSSPDYDIFTNTNASTGKSSSSTDTASANGIKRQVMLHFSSITAMLSAILLSIF